MWFERKRRRERHAWKATDGNDGLLLHKLQKNVTMKCLFKKQCVSSTHKTYKLTHAHTHSLKRNEDKGFWRPWLAVFFVKVELTYLHMHAHKCLGPWILCQRRTESRKQRHKGKWQSRKLFLCLPAEVTAALKFPFNYIFSWVRSPKDGQLSATVAGSVDKLKTCRNKSVTSVWLVAGVYSQPSDHVRGEEGQWEGATSTSTHIRPDSLQRTCRAGFLLRVSPRSRSLHRSPRATSCQTSCPLTPWSSLLHSGKTVRPTTSAKKVYNLIKH